MKFAGRVSGGVGVGVGLPYPIAARRKAASVMSFFLLSPWGDFVL
jgi:hypothetical protein